MGWAEDYRHIPADSQKQEGSEETSEPLIFLVAGPGFEPGTFGLWAAFQA